MSTLAGSNSQTRVVVRSAVSHQSDASLAVGELVAALGQEADLYAVFVAPGFDLAAVAAATRAAFGDRVIGCTSAGNIGANGYDLTGIGAIALTGGALSARTIALGPLDDPCAVVEENGAAIAELRAGIGDADGFAVLLTDGLRGNEDVLTASLMAALGDVPIIGASAGDDLTFRRTAVYYNGQFSENLATVTVVRTDAPFRLMRVQHHEATGTVLVATDVDPDRRIVRAINGRPAARAYAEAVGLPVGELTPTVFSRYPLLLNAGGTSWIRSIAEVEAHDFLRMFARVDVGDVLRLGRPQAMLEKLGACLEGVAAELGSIGGMLVFDCILRRLEFESEGLTGQVGALLAAHHATGFSSYGEQFNGMHMNQTLVAVAFA
ncbi:FIST N-terminal domain-containing protein [Winogradskya humida]|uniref:FIST-like protein n=1 Tax=Winogradskya humida TaxID=113566 RepID=A0ABQ3ZWJ3_9ACTN|nr:FIST N-terminal domain-containing protein [Actinoplanes humidus]GIE22948.1 hypothetical protein Ahu01nite_060500 [Actinoplanes humidus]